MASYVIFLLIARMALNLLFISSTKASEGESAGDGQTPLIIGGYPAIDHVYAKHMVSIYRGGNHACGGSIISPKTIMTAAHCLINQNLNRYHNSVDFIIFAGSSLLSGRSPTIKMFQVRATLAHPKYKISRVGRYDLGLMFLYYRIELDKTTTGAIPLANRDVILNEPCTTLGWGLLTTDERELTPSQLYYIDIIVLSLKECNKKASKKIDIFCAGVRSGPPKSSYQGDSGGPIICDSRLAGLVSYGKITGLGPTYFTNVFKYREWIMANTEEPIPDNSSKITIDAACLILFYFVYI